MQSANLSGPLKGLRPYQALIGPTQASGLAGGFDFHDSVFAVYFTFFAFAMPLIIPREVISRDCPGSRRTVTVA